MDKDDLKALYELSLQPGFAVVIGLMQITAVEHAAPIPRRDEDKTAWDTFCMVRGAIEEAMRKIQDAVARGKELTDPYNTGDNTHGEETGYSGRTRA